MMRQPDEMLLEIWVLNLMILTQVDSEEVLISWMTYLMEYNGTKESTKEKRLP